MRLLYFKPREMDLTCLFHAKDIYCKKRRLLLNAKRRRRALERAHANISEGERKDNIDYFSL